jgi:hypothetical protein
MQRRPGEALHVRFSGHECRVLGHKLLTQLTQLLVLSREQQQLLVSLLRRVSG